MRRAGRRRRRKKRDSSSAAPVRRTPPLRAAEPPRAALSSRRRRRRRAAIRRPEPRARGFRHLACLSLTLRSIWGSAFCWCARPARKAFRQRRRDARRCLAMARLACPEEPHATLHVVQRGSDRRACFSGANDRAAYLDALRECSMREVCAIHAYALMGNHVHLLLTSERARGASRLMPGVVTGYAQYLWDEYAHEGAVWEEAY